MTEASFAAALLDPAAPLPTDLVGPDGKPALRRFSIYRNNVAIGLTEALQTAFPVVRKLVGDTFFTAMAGTFLRSHPPQSRMMMFYGSAFPDFLAGFPPVAQLAYLPDVARLEQSLRESYHAADTDPIAPEALASLPQSALITARLAFAPSVRLIRSAWPIHAIWLVNTRGGPVVQPQGQDVVILRPDFDSEPHLLPPGGGAFLAALMSGDTLSNALNSAGPDLDLTAALTLLLNGRAITGVSR